MTMLGAPRPPLVRQFPSRRGILQRIPKAQYSTSEPKDNQERLNWDAYLRLRKQRRLAGVVTTWPTTLLAAWIKHLLSLTKNGSYSAIVWCTYNGTYAQFDPMIVFLCATAACTGLGWLVGPSFGSGIWNLLHRGQAGQMARRDKEFYEHIHRMRADASKHNVHKPMPDYYGEKIGSLHEYRHWLRKQVCWMHD